MSNKSICVPGSGMNCSPPGNVGEFAQACSCPAQLIPEAEWAVARFELPLSAADVAYLSQAEIHLFADPVVPAVTGPVMTTSNGLSLANSISFDKNFIMVGLGFYAYADPTCFTQHGNTFGPRVSAQAGVASPDNMWAEQAAINVLVTGSPILPVVPTITPLTSCPATVDYGGPALRMIWALMHAFRLQMKCPTSNWEMFLDMPLSELGSICAEASIAGWGNPSIAQDRLLQALNDRMAGMTFPATWADPGIFFSRNCHLSNDSPALAPANVFHTTPLGRMPADASYGKAFSSTGYEAMVSLPYPIPFPVAQRTPLRIALVPELGGASYLAQALAEGTGHHNHVGGGAVDRFNVLEATGAAIQQAYLDSQTIPGGAVTLGLCIRGFEVRESCIEQLLEIYKSSPSLQSALAQIQAMAASGALGTPTDVRMSLPVGQMGR